MTDTIKDKRVYIVPRTWIGRFFTAVVTIVLVCLAVFFFTIFFVVVSILAIVIIAKVLWYQKQSSRKGPENVIEGVYTVEDAKTHCPSQTQLSDSQSFKDSDNENRHS